MEDREKPALEKKGATESSKASSEPSMVTVPTWVTMTTTVPWREWSSGMRAQPRMLRDTVAPVGEVTSR